MLLPSLAAAWLAGFAAVGALNAPPWLAAAWLVGASPFVLAVRDRRSAALTLAAALLALLGGLRYADWEGRAVPPLAAHVGERVVLEGVVDSEGDPGLTTTRYTVRVARVGEGAAEAATEGGVIITVGQYLELLPGDHVRLTGALEPPPELASFDYAGYLARQGIVATMLFPTVEPAGAAPAQSPARWAARARRTLERALQHSLPEPEASLGAGIAFGRDDAMPRALIDDFRATGLAHLVAVSGANVALIAGMVFLAARRLLRPGQAALPAAIAVIAYVLVAGASASVIRAGLMAGVFLVGLAIGRPQAGLAALAAAAILMTALDPGAAADVGFQLSFAATAGLIAFGPWFGYGLRTAMTRARIAPFVPGLIIEVAALSLAANLATLPIVAATFGRVSLIGIAANVVVEPIFAVAFVSSLLTAIAGAAWEPAGWAAGLVTYYPLALISWSAGAFASVPWASVGVPRMAPERTAGAMTLLAATGWLAYRRFPPDPAPARGKPPRAYRRIALVAAAGGLVAAVAPTSLLAIGGPGSLTITMLDVGQGDAILVTTPHGHRTLVDGGASAIGLARELSAVLAHWERNIGLLLVTHPQEDHLGAIPGAFARYNIGQAAETGAENSTTAYTLYRERAGVRRVLARGDAWTEDGVRFEVLWPPHDDRERDLNDTSLVLRITYREMSVLLTGDLQAKAQAELLLLEDLSADVLKVPHHGGATNQASFFRQVSPALALISAGAGNRFGHPSAETLTQLEGIETFRTDTDGRIEVRLDGARIRVRTER